MRDLYTPTPPDLKKLNMSLVEWYEVHDEQVVDEQTIFDEQLELSV